MSDEIKKGLLGIVVDETEVSKVMPEINSLTYRGKCFYYYNYNDQCVCYWSSRLVFYNKTFY